MAIKALTLSRTKVHESDLDPAKGTPDATQFTIGAIDSYISSYVFDRTLVFGESAGGEREVAQVKMNESNIDVVRFGLKGWKNFKDEDNNDVEFTTVERVVMGKKYVAASDECIARMDIALIRDLASAIREINVVTKDEAGKSDAA